MKVIFYHPYEVKANPATGSEVRVSTALKEMRRVYGKENVFVVSGFSKERKERIKELRRRVREGERFDYAYMESLNFPIVVSDPGHFPRRPFLDFSFIAWMKRQGIPLGVFYRDCYWRLPLFWKQYRPLQATVLYALFYIEFVFVRRFSKVFFLPSLKMATHLPINFGVGKYDEFPPGVDIKVKGYEIKKGVSSFFYVGGVLPPLYDLTPMFDFFRSVHGATLTVCCRRAEWLKVMDYYNPPAAVKVVHESGSALKKIYERADAFLIYRVPDEYLDMTVPVKIFESAGYAVPVVVYGSGNDAFVAEKTGLGISFERKEELVDIIFGKNKKWEQLCNAFQESREKNSWDSRFLLLEKKLKMGCKGAGR